MATDEYIWDLVLHEAAAGGALDLEYLNDDRQLYGSSFGKATPTVPSIDNLFTDYLLDDLFSFDNDVIPSYKPAGNETIVATDILPEDVGDLAAGIFYTDSFVLDNVCKVASPAAVTAVYETPIPDQFTSYTLKPEFVASSPDHLQYVADNSQSYAHVTSPAESPEFDFEIPAPIAFPDFTPDMLSRLLASLTQVECDGEEMTSSFCDEGVYMMTEDSANSSEMEDDGAETDSESIISEVISPRGGGRGRGSSKVAGGARGGDRKKRKMQQNRVAAYRYRQKKKAEQDASFAERDGLEKRNSHLKTKVQQMTQEISYLRGLMADMVKVRSAVKQ